jgi:MFS family permease
VSLATPSVEAVTGRQPRLFYGWVIVATAFVTMAIGVNARTAFSLLFPAILDEFGWSRGTIAGAFAVGLFASTLFAPFIGLLMDRFGPRVVFPCGIVLVSAGLALATGVRAPWQLHLTLGVLVAGGSVSVSYMGHSLFLPNWFVRRRGLAIGLAFSGVGIGSIVLLPWLQGIISRDGWRAACWMLAGIVLVVLLPLNLLVPRLRPAELGLRPDGDPAAPGPDRRSGERTTVERASDRVVDRAWAAVDWTLPRAMRTSRFWWLALAYFGGLFAWYAIQVHQTKYLLEIGFAPGPAAYALGLVGLTGIAGGIALGHLSDRVGREWAWSLGSLGFALCFAVLLVMKTHPTPELLYLMVGAQGLLGYGMASVFGAIPAELFEGRRYGAIFGTLNLASNAGAGVGPWVTGLIHDHTGSYAPAFTLGIGLSLVSMVAVWLAAPRKVRAVAGRALRQKGVQRE